MSSQPSPRSFIQRASGRSITQILVGGIGGFLLALASAAIHGTQAVVALLLLPFELFVDVGEASVQQLILTPLGITNIGARVTEIGIIQLIGQGAALLGLPISIFIALVSIGIVIAFVALSPTSNVLPGLITDNPVWDFLFGTPEEEVEGED